MAATPTEVAAVLADPTRFKIYESLSRSRPQAYTAHEVAEKFFLHPNVARTHLGRLEEVGLVESFLEKSGRGGRPARRYRALDRAVTLQFPRRDWLWLARLLTRTVEELGPSALAAAQRLAYEEGLTLGRALAGRVLRPSGRLAGVGVDAEAPSSAAEALALESLQAALDADGAVGQGSWERRDGQLHVRFCTCALREIAEEHPQTVCSLHRSYLHGLVEALVGPVDMVAESSMLAGDEATCDWRFCPAGAPCAALSTAVSTP